MFPVSNTTRRVWELDRVYKRANYFSMLELEIYSRCSIYMSSQHLRMERIRAPLMARFIPILDTSWVLKSVLCPYFFGVEQEASG